MGVYSNIQIKQALDEGRIICYPLNPKNITYASLDVTLGYYYYRIEPSDERIVYNPFSQEEVERYFDGPHIAISHKKWCAKNGIMPVEGIPLDHPIIAIKPGERILAHTHEFFGILPPGACDLHSRSSWARNGIAVCFDAGWIDPGYINRITLEIFNLNHRETILLPVGERIAQAVFYDTGSVDSSYGDNKDERKHDKYQSGVDLNYLIKTWSPNMLLPKAYKDTRQLPEKIEGSVYE